MSLCTTTAVSASAVELAGPAVDLDVAEAVEGEAGLPRLGAAAPEGVAVGGLGGAVGLELGLAVDQRLAGVRG